jgi:hypothetical protein
MKHLIHTIVTTFFFALVSTQAFAQGAPLPPPPAEPPGGSIGAPLPSPPRVAPTYAPQELDRIYGSGSDACPNTYRHPDAVRT